MSNARLRSFHLVSSLCLLFAFPSFGVDSAATNTTPAAVTNKTETNVSSDDALRAYLQLQEQIHEAQLAIERNRQDSETASARSAAMLAERLQGIEQSLAAQRATELEAVQQANHTMLVVVSGVAALGCLAVLLTADFQGRAVNRFTAISAAFPMANGLGPFRAVAALEAGEHSLTTIGSVEQVNIRLLGAIERLEKRIQDLERTSSAHPPLNEGPAVNNIVDLQSADAAPAESPAGSASAGKPSDIDSLLGKGQSLLNLAKPEEAAVCFDEVLAQDPGHAEAWVKKGVALERMRKPQEALGCYDRAIAADNSLTIAYLYKGGLFNRMERFSEALECYERALHTQEKRRAS
jgi:tetratricopeptide (TPR) repeat protein